MFTSYLFSFFLSFFVSTVFANQTEQNTVFTNKTPLSQEQVTQLEKRVISWGNTYLVAPCPWENNLLPTVLNPMQMQDVANLISLYYLDATFDISLYTYASTLVTCQKKILENQQSEKKPIKEIAAIKIINAKLLSIISEKKINRREIKKSKDHIKHSDERAIFNTVKAFQEDSKQLLITFIGKDTEKISKNLNSFLVKTIKQSKILVTMVTANKTAPPLTIDKHYQNLDQKLKVIQVIYDAYYQGTLYAIHS